jgi:tRNA pseudouridine55 synthase
MTLKSKLGENSHGARLIITLYKKRGETPLECLDRFRIENPEYKNEKMTYAGRLDPLAEGLLLVLTGEECKNKEKYLGLDKTYEVDVLFGFATDTYDLLGKVIGAEKDHLEARLPSEEILKLFVGKFNQKYPAYSSKFFNKARSGELTKDEITEKEVEIKSIELLGERMISKNDLEKYIIESIGLVKGDFRQEEILKEWKNVLRRTVLRKFVVISIRIDCTSGTYMRALANSIGEKVGIPALVLNIKRIKIGGFEI